MSIQWKQWVARPNVGNWPTMSVDKLSFSFSISSLGSASVLSVLGRRNSSYYPTLWDYPFSPFVPNALVCLCCVFILCLTCLDMSPWQNSRSTQSPPREVASEFWMQCGFCLGTKIVLREQKSAIHTEVQIHLCSPYLPLLTFVLRFGTLCFSQVHIFIDIPICRMI